MDCRELHPASIAIRTTSDAGSLADQAVADLCQLFTDRNDCTPEGDDFIIILAMAEEQGGVIDASIDVDRLRSLPNNDQAYIIQPVGRDQLVVVALNGRTVSPLTEK